MPRRRTRRKRKAAPRRATRAVARVRPRRRRRIRRTARRVGRRVRRAAGTVARKAWDEKHTLVACAAGAAMGAIKGRDIEGTLNKMPLVKQLTLPGVIGVALFVLSKVLKTGQAAKITGHAATGALAIASYNLGAKYLGKGTTAGYEMLGVDDDEDILFEEDY